MSTTKPPPHPSRPHITAHLILRRLLGLGKGPRTGVEEDEEHEEVFVVVHASAWLDPWSLAAVHGDRRDNAPIFR